MPPLPYNNSSIIFVQYAAQGKPHTMQFRYFGTGAPPAALLTAIDTFMVALKPLMPTNTAYTATTFQVEGENFSTSLTWTPSSWAGGVTAKPADAPGYFNFIGRSTAGRRVRVAVLGAGATPVTSTGTSADYRLTSVESAPIASAIAALRSVAFTAIDKQTVVWKDYANLGYNAHWQKKLRT